MTYFCPSWLYHGPVPSIRGTCLAFPGPSCRRGEGHRVLAARLFRRGSGCGTRGRCRGPTALRWASGPAFLLVNAPLMTPSRRHLERRVLGLRTEPLGLLDRQEIERGVGNGRRLFVVGALGRHLLRQVRPTPFITMLLLPLSVFFWTKALTTTLGRWWRFLRQAHPPFFMVTASFLMPSPLGRKERCRHRATAGASFVKRVLALLSL